VVEDVEHNKICLPLPREGFLRWECACRRWTLTGVLSFISLMMLASCGLVLEPDTVMDTVDPSPPSVELSRGKGLTLDSQTCSPWIGNKYAGPEERRGH
jgi:hypothetical protein